MGDAPTQQEVDREQAMLLLYSQGYSFAAMVGPLHAFNLLKCDDLHRDRQDGRGGKVCATCENTIAATWRRHMARIGADKEEIAEVKGAWLTVHMLVEQICISRFASDVVTTETRTEIVDGQPVTTTTERREPRTNVGLLRLMCEVRDKMARMGGLNVKNPPSSRKVSRRLLAVTERTNEPDEHGDGPAN